MKAGDKVLVSDFKPNEKVDVIGVSKGRGFAGLVKRHHFGGGDATHGSHASPRAGFDRRIELSVACRAGYAHGADIWETSR